MPQPRQQRGNDGAAVKQQAIAATVAAPAPPTLQKAPPPPSRKAVAPPAPTRQPAASATNKAARKTNTKKKKANPKSTTPFNHRARFTKLKRGVHAQRRWAASQLADTHVRDVTLSATPPAAAPASSASPAAEEADNHEVWQDEPSALEPPRVDVWRSVAAMDALYARLDAAMKAHSFRHAGRLKKAIRARQLGLRRVLTIQASQLGSQATSTPSGATADTRNSATPSGPYRSFHPPSTWMGLGRHPRSAWVDQRTGRYPQHSSEAHVQAVVRCFMDGHIADSGSVPDPCAGMVAIASSCASLLPSTTAVSRKQRAMRESLFTAAYCANAVTDALDDLCFTLLQGLHTEQLELRQRQPLQFKARQRYVVGFQEVLKCLRAGRVRLVLLATDVEAIAAAPPPGEQTSAPCPVATAPTQVSRPTRRKAFQTLHEAVQQVQQACSETQRGNSTRAPPLCVTCMSRQRLSYALHAKGSKIGCVAVLQAEKNREALKAVTCYGRYLVSVYAAEMETEQAAHESGGATVSEL